MNYRRGLVRLWIAFSAVFLVFALVSADPYGATSRYLEARDQARSAVVARDAAAAKRDAARATRDAAVAKANDLRNASVLPAGADPYSPDVITLSHAVVDALRDAVRTRVDASTAQLAAEDAEREMPTGVNSRGQGQGRAFRFLR